MIFLFRIWSVDFLGSLMTLFKSDGSRSDLVGHPEAVCVCVCVCVDVLMSVLVWLTVGWLCWSQCDCVDVLLCWWVVMIDMIADVLMTVLMGWWSCWCLVVLVPCWLRWWLCWWLCWWVDDRVDALLCWCLVDYVDDCVDALLIMLMIVLMRRRVDDWCVDFLNTTSKTFVNNQI